MGAIVGGLVGQNAARHGRQDQEGKYAEALGQYGFDIPDIHEQELQLEHLSNAGNMNASQEGLVQQGQSGMANIQLDPRLAQAQMSALNQLSQTGQMGMTPAEQAALSDAQRQAASMAQAKSAQIMDQFARTGMGGSGAQLAAQLQNAQSSADRASQNSNAIAQQAQQAALQAMTQSGTLAGQMSNQSFNQQADQAKAQDYINQFNAQNAQGVNSRNTQAQNTAQAYNVQNNQNLANQNVGLDNQQQTYNKGLLQQQFNNRMAKAAPMAGIQMKQGDQQAAAGAAEGQGYQQTGQAADDAVKKIFTYGMG